MVERTGTRELCIGKVDKDPTSGTIQNESVDYDNSIIFQGRNFSMSGINSEHHYLPTYQILMIPDIEKFLPVAIFKMAATIPQKFIIVRYHQNLICG